MNILERRLYYWSFDFSPRSPSTSYSKNEIMEHSFNSFHDSLTKYQSRKYPGKYLKITTLRQGRYEGEGNYDMIEEGAFFCRVANCILPALNFDLKLFSKELKNFHYKPAQIELELPNGTIVPMFSDSIQIDKPGWHHTGGLTGYDRHEYRITQRYSQELYDVCERYLYYGRHISPMEKYDLQFDIYKENEQDRFADAIIAHKRKCEKEKSTYHISLQNHIPEKRWTNDEITDLWRQSSTTI